MGPTSAAARKADNRPRKTDRRINRRAQRRVLRSFSLLPMVDERIHYLARHHGTSASAVVNAIIGEIDYAHVFALFSASPPLTLSAIVIETHMSPTMVRELHREFLDG